MSFDLHSLDFSNINEDKKELYKYIYSSLEGSVYDIAQLVHFLYKDEYRVAKLKSKMWYVFDGLKWKQSELGPYYELSTNVVGIYMNILNEENDKKKNIHEHLDSHQEELCTDTDIIYYKNTLKTTDRIISNLEKIIMKLKNVNTKESICKECLYLFYDPDFLSKLDTNHNLICFLNGILDLEHKTLRAGQSSDYISIVVNANFTPPKTINENKELSILLENFHNFRRKITMKRQNKFLFMV